MSASDEEIGDDSDTAAAPKITETTDLDSHLAGEDSETVAAPEITETTDLDPHLAFSSVPRRLQPVTTARDRERAADGGRTRSILYMVTLCYAW